MWSNSPSSRVWGKLYPPRTQLLDFCALVPCSNVVIFTTTAPVCVWKPIHLHVMFWSQSRYTSKKRLVWQTERQRREGGEKKRWILKASTRPPQNNNVIQVTHTAPAFLTDIVTTMPEKQNSKTSVTAIAFHHPPPWPCCFPELTKFWNSHPGSVQNTCTLAHTIHLFQ